MSEFKRFSAMRTISYERCCNKMEIVVLNEFCVENEIKENYYHVCLITRNYVEITRS